jgi:hypothetical protein
VSNKQTAESFWVRVNKGKKAECWEWQGSCNNTGYGTVSWDGTVYTAHRLSAWIVGLVTSPSAPDSSRALTHVLHKCDNRKCCNPNHFFLGSYTDNQKDAYSKNRKTQPKGSAHVNSKLSAKQVAQIRKRYAKGEYQIPLAKEFGVSQRAISLIVRGETYK